MSSIQNPKSQIKNSLPRFSDPDVVSSIGIQHLEELFARFKEALAANNVSLPSRSFDYSVRAAAWADLLSCPDALPEPLLNALLAIEEFASPKNKRLCENLAAAAHLDDSRVPEGWALRLWLRSPYDTAYIKTLQAHVPPDFFDDEEFEDPDDLSNDCSRRGDEADPLAAGSSCRGNEADSPSQIDCRRRREETHSRHDSPAIPSTLNPQPSTAVEINPCPRNKIARLPKEVRDSIDQMFAQGFTIDEIRQNLGEVTRVLNKSNLSR